MVDGRTEVGADATEHKGRLKYCGERQVAVVSPAPRSIRPTGLSGAGKRRGPAVAGRDRRAVAASVTSPRVPACRKPACRGVGRDALPLVVWCFSAFPSRVAGRTLCAAPLFLVACGGDRSAVGRRTLLPTADLKNGRRPLFPPELFDQHRPLMRSVVRIGHISKKQVGEARSPLCSKQNSFVTAL